MSESARKVLKISYLLGAISSIAIILKGDSGWACGFMIGIIWCAANYALTIGLFEIAVLKKDARALKRILIVKFPVLYLSGFFIMRSGYFPLMSLLSGAGLVIAVIGVYNTVLRRI